MSKISVPDSMPQHIEPIGNERPRKNINDQIQKANEQQSINEKQIQSAKYIFAKDSEVSSIIPYSICSSSSRTIPFNMQIQRLINIQDAFLPVELQPGAGPVVVVPLFVLLFAEPAPLKPADSAGHVVAAFVFFGFQLAARTFFQLFLFLIRVEIHRLI